MMPRPAPTWIVLGAFLATQALAPGLDLDGESATFASLPSETVTLTGRSELHLTDPGDPIPGTLVNLDSPDAWLFFHAVQPSDANSNLLPRIRVNGDPAVHGSNVRVVQYANGTVVVPHPADYQPLTLYEGENFTGESMSLDPYTPYGTAQLGAMASSASSFILKRGYTVTFAQNNDGSGRSRNYVAADGDIEVGAAPDWMNDRVHFVRVFPWRWTSKKGSCDVSPGALDADWHYNWDINQSSPLDWEYVAIRQTRWWPGLNQNWESRGINHLSGFNEPANPVEDAYESLNGGQAGLAVDAWSDLLGTGLRVGAPAVTDGGRYWLYDFIDRADAAGKRVDYVPIHFYWSYWNNDDPGGAAYQLYSFLKEVHDRVQRPIWLTEFNNGANWTGNAPTTGQNRNVIQAMINMMDDTPWIERYAIYSDVEWVRETHYDDGTLTPMGQMYRDHKAPMAHVQAMKPNRTRVASYYFDGDCRDASGCGNHGMAVGFPVHADGRNGEAIELGGACSHVQLPGDIVSSSAFTFAAWVHWNGGGNNQRIFDFGNYDLSQYMALTPSMDAGGEKMRFALRNGGGTQWLSTSAPLPSGSWQHVAVTKSGDTARIYLNGVEQASGTMSVPTLSGTLYNYLGKSQWPADPGFSGRIDEVHIANYAMSREDIVGMVDNTMGMEVPAGEVTATPAVQGVPYSGSVAGVASDPDAGSITYYKIFGPDWLDVAPDGTLSGTPDPGLEGPQIFTVRAHDSEGERRFFMLTIDLPYVLGDGTWIADSDGSWSEAAKWSDQFPANGPGQTADFSTIDLTADRTVVVDGSHHLGALRFGDASGSQSWHLAEGGGALTMDSDSPDPPSIVVENGLASIAASLAGSNGFAKSGAGDLVLAGPNSLSGTVDIDTNDSGADGGVLRAAHPAALAAVDTIRIRNNNNGYSELQLDGGAGDLWVPARLEVNCRANDEPTIRNLSGTNTLAGDIDLNVGGDRFNIRSDSGLLVMAGRNRYIGELTGGRVYAFSGAGDHRVTGLILEPGNGAPVSLSKSGMGTLTLDGLNNYNAETTVSGGRLVVNGSTGAGGTTVEAGATLAGGGTVGADLVAEPGATVIVGGEGFGSAPDTPFARIDDFQGYSAGQIGPVPNTTANLWTGVHDGTANAEIVSEDGDRAMAVRGVGSAWRGAITDLRDGRNSDFSLPDGETGTYFLRVRSSGVSSADFIFGLSDLPASTASAPGNDAVSPWNEYAVTLSIGSGNLRANAGASGFVPVSAIEDNAWMNLWIVVDNATKTYRVATSTGSDDGVLFGQDFDFGRRTATSVGSAPLVTFGLHEQLNVPCEIDDLHFAPGVHLGNPLEVRTMTPVGGTLRVAGDFELMAGSTLELDVATGALHDRLVVGGPFTADGILKVGLDPARPQPIAGDRFVLIDANSSNIGFSELDLPGLFPGLSWDTSEIGSGVLEVTGSTSSYWTWTNPIAFPPGGDAPEASADGGAAANLFEFLAGTDPLDPTDDVLPPGAIVSAAELGLPGDNHHFAITARLRKDRAGVVVFAEAAATLAGLAQPGAAANAVEITPAVEDVEDGDFEFVTWYYDVAIEDSPHGGYMRLKALVE